MGTFTFATKILDDHALMLFVHGVDAPDDATWELAMKETAKQLATHPTKFAQLVVTDGGAPSATQRKRLAEATREARYPLVVINTNPLIRGVITAISWMNPGIKAFAPNKFKDAVAHVGCSDAATVLEELRRLQKTLGAKVACLEAVAI